MYNVYQNLIADSGWVGLKARHRYSNNIISVHAVHSCMYSYSTRHLIDFYVHMYMQVHVAIYRLLTASYILNYMHCITYAKLIIIVGGDSP